MSSIWGCFVCGLSATDPRIVVLGTGGTIAGTGLDPARSWAYQAAQLSVAQLLTAVPELEDVPLEAHQVAQIDSKDMGDEVWRELARALALHLSRQEVMGVVITHGTDTLEETAWLLHALHDGHKPVVLAAAMRPATAPDADGPENLSDAMRVVQGAVQRGWGGVAVVMHGRVWSAADVRKSHTRAIDAFDGGGQGPLATISSCSQMGQTGMRIPRQISWLTPWPSSGAFGWSALERPWPRVEVVSSHAGADGWIVQAMLAHAADTATPLQGIVVACTGNGTIHAGLTNALREAARQGVAVWRSSRVARGGVWAAPEDEWPGFPHLTVAQARVALSLSILGYSAFVGDSIRRI